MIKLFFQTALALLLFLIIVTGCTNAQNSSKMTESKNPEIIELTTFQLNEGVEESNFIEVAQTMQKEFLLHQEGFLKRTLVKGENEWTDIVYWENKKSHESAMQKSQNTPIVAPFMQMINFQSVKMNLTKVKLNKN